MTTLIVGNLPYSVREEEIRPLFEGFGIGSVRIIEGKGIAFIDVQHPAEAIAGTWDAQGRGRKLRARLAD